jgi:hypothetical protein
MQVHTQSMTEPEYEYEKTLHGIAGYWLWAVFFGLIFIGSVIQLVINPGIASLIWFAITAVIAVMYFRKKPRHLDGVY